MGLKQGRQFEEMVGIAAFDEDGHSLGLLLAECLLHLFRIAKGTILTIYLLEFFSYQPYLIEVGFL